MITDSRSAREEVEVFEDANEGFNMMKNRIRLAATGDFEQDPPDSDPLSTFDVSITSLSLSPTSRYLSLGRSDGSCFILKIGTESFASFLGKDVLSEGGGNTFKNFYRFVREGGTSDDEDPQDPGTDKSTPFEIVAQFQHDKSITSITNLNEDTFITGDISGNIFQLKIEEVEGHIKYGEVIKGLKSVGDKLIVLSESEEESMIAVFALPLGEGEEPLKEWRGEKGMEYLSVTDEKIFAATEEVISVFDMNLNELHSFKPHSPDSKITALHAIQSDPDMRPTDEEESCVVSGTDGGVLLQHQILKTEGGVRHWPVLGNQRMKRKAHTFKTSNSPITAIIGSWSKIITCDALGTVRFFSSNKGGECLYTMDGLEECDCLDLRGDVMVSNGMERGFVCLHDFGAIDAEIDFGEVDYLD